MLYSWLSNLGVWIQELRTQYRIEILELTSHRWGGRLSIATASDLEADSNTFEFEDCDSRSLVHIMKNGPIQFPVVVKRLESLCEG